MKNYDQLFKTLMTNKKVFKTLLAVIIDDSGQK